MHLKGGEGAPQFDMEVNAFADMTDEEFLESRTGLKIPEKRSK